MHIRLVAIAKNEAAYLPEWIFHHQYFGFNDIEILVNQTQDNTDRLARQLQSLAGVRFLNVDALLDSSDTTPFQLAAYEGAFQRAIASGVSHLLFLDIDEYWTPRDYQHSIQEYMQDHISADVIAFPWFVPKDDTDRFSMPFRSTQDLYANELVKSIFRTNKRMQRIGVHIPDSVDESTVYYSSHGLRLPHNPGPKPLVTTGGAALPDAFVLHRMWRSPLEYVYRLGEGMRQAVCSHADSAPIKTNRRGYGKLTDNLPLSFSISSNLYSSYAKAYAQFLCDWNLQPHLLSARNRIQSRIPEVVAILQTLEPDHAAALLERINFDLLFKSPDEWASASSADQIS